MAQELSYDVRKDYAAGIGSQLEQLMGGRQIVMREFPPEHFELGPNETGVYDRKIHGFYRVKPGVRVDGTFF